MNASTALCIDVLLAFFLFLLGTGVANISVC